MLLLDEKYNEIMVSFDILSLEEISQGDRQMERWTDTEKMRKSAMFSPHISAEMNVESGRYERQASYHHWNLEAISY